MCILCMQCKGALIIHRKRSKKGFYFSYFGTHKAKKWKKKHVKIKELCEIEKLSTNAIYKKYMCVYCVMYPFTPCDIWRKQKELLQMKKEKKKQVERREKTQSKGEWKQNNSRFLCGKYKRLHSKTEQVKQGEKKKESVNAISCGK